MQAMADWRALKNKAGVLGSRIKGLLWCRPPGRIMLHESAYQFPPTRKSNTLVSRALNLLKWLVAARPRFAHTQPRNARTTHR